jgi:hypothetical protein
MGANDLHGAALRKDAGRGRRLPTLSGISCPKPMAIDFGSGAPGCYKATVNESETINDAKRFRMVPGGKSVGLRQPVIRFPVAPFIERS